MTLRRPWTDTGSVPSVARAAARSDVQSERVDVDPEQAELLDPGAGEPLRRAGARRRERRREPDPAVGFDERRRRHDRGRLTAVALRE